MRKGKLKFIIITLIIIMLIMITGIVVLAMTTDVFKSDEILFKKYIAQNFQNISDISDIEEEEQVIDWLRKNDYTEKSSIELTYQEGEKDNQEKYQINEQGTIKKAEKASHRNIKITYDDLELMNIDLLAQNDTYGFRLSNLVQQFVSVKSSILSDLGMAEEDYYEKLQSVDLSGILKFSDEELETLSNNYINAIFTDIDPKSYSSTDALITLNNEKSINTKAYTLTITKNELDKVHKRLLNHTISDEIILSKLDEIDAKMKEVGLVEQEGESIKETFISKLKEKAEKIEYEGTDTTETSFTVYQTDGITVRTLIKMPDTEYTIDLDDTEGKIISFKTSEIVEDKNEVTIYSVGKSKTDQGTKRTIKYEKDDQNIEITVDASKSETELNAKTNIKYSSNDIANLNIAADTNIVSGATNAIPITFNEQNNILLNEHVEKIESILNSLKNIAVNSIKNSQSQINTKLLDNIINCLDEREEEKQAELKANMELQKQRFNNQFSLYEGENVEYQYIRKLLTTAGRNMSGYQVISGSRIRLFIEDGSSNEEKANDIISVLSERRTYNVEMQYSDDGYINSIDISIYNKD